MPRPRGEWPSPPKEVPITVLADWVGVSRQTLYEAVRDPTTPKRKLKDGTYLFPWPEFNLWWHQRAVQRARRPEPAADPMAAVRVERAKLELETARLELEERRGGHMLVAEHQALVQAMLERVRTGLLLLPNRLAPRVIGYDDPALVRPVITREIDTLMGTFAEAPPA